MTDDGRRSSPSALRNREPILRLLREELPATGVVLEIASGTGEHVDRFAHALRGLTWQPSDPDPEARSSIAAWSAQRGLANVRPPIDIDAASPKWPLSAADAILCINMAHIAPWEATEGLMRGAGRLLPEGGPLIVYGPFRRSDRELEPSNAAFDADLRRRDPAWGLREVDALAACAAQHGLRLDRQVDMPANNLTLVFRRGSVAR